jgi:hypothetical protein
MKGGEKLSGGMVDLDAALVGVKDIGKNFQVLPGSGDPTRYAANSRLVANEMQVGINNISGGGIASTSMTVDCPSVVGSTPQQQANSCALFKTSAETNIQTRLFNQLGGRRKRKRRTTIKGNKRRGKKSRAKKSRAKKSRAKKSHDKKSRGKKRRGNKSIRDKNRKFTKRR